MSTTATDNAVILGGVSVIAATLLYRACQSSKPQSPNNGNCKDKTSDSNKLVSPAQDNYPDDIKHELHSRVKTFFNEEGFSKLQNSFIIVSDVFTCVLCASQCNRFFLPMLCTDRRTWRRWKPLRQHAGALWCGAREAD